MPNIVMNSFKKKIMGGAISLSASPVACALVSDSISTIGTTLFSATSWSQVSAYEVTGTGYTAGGKLLQNMGVIESDSNNLSFWSASDVTWSTSTIVASGTVLYVSGTNDLILYGDFGADKTSTNGDFIVQWDKTYGILKCN